jgi:hypothetical protein
MRCLRRILVAFSILSVSILCGCHPKAVLVETEDESFSESDQLNLAMKQEFFMTRDPALGYVPKERLFAAKAYMQRLMASRGGGVNALEWQERGPNNIAGRTRAFFIDSRDATGNTIFSASVSGGIWKCTNFKSTPVWTPLDESMGNLNVCALTQDPSNPNVMYAGTGEGWFNLDATRGNGIWKSTNGGTTWAKLAATDSSAFNKGHNFDYVQDIVVTSTGVVFASTRPSLFCNTGGVWRSTDGGTTWTRVIGNYPGSGGCANAFNFYGADLEIASNGDVYATTGFNNEGENNNLGRIFRSSAATNGANVGAAGTWNDITPAGTWKRIDLGCAPSNPAVVYALLQGSGDGIGSIKKTTNSGASWTDLPLPNWCSQGVNGNDFTNNQAWFNLIVAVDPNDANTAFIGGLDILKTTDGGASWTQLTQWATGCSVPTIHADQHDIVFLPGSSNEVIVSNDGGLYYSSDKGATWSTYSIPSLHPGYNLSLSTKNIGYNVTQLYACDVHPILANYMLAGAQDNGTQRFNGAGINSTTEASLGGDGGFCHIDQRDGAIQIASYVYNNYFYSKNNGATFTRVKFNDKGFFINPSDYDDAKKVLYSSDDVDKMGLTNFAVSGTPSFTDVSVTALGGRRISALKVDPTIATGGTIWIAGTDSTSANKPNLIKLTNANTSSPTVVANTVLSGVPAGSYISSIDVEPANADHLLVTLTNYGITSVFESINGGASFTAIEGNLPDMPVRWGMFVPSDASVTGAEAGGILLATELGVWFTQHTNGNSTTWTPQDGGLPNIRTDMLRYRASDNLLAVATHGRGLFTTNLVSLRGPDTTTSFVKYISVSQNQLLIKTGNLPTTSSLNIRIFDAIGRLMYSKEVPYEDQLLNIQMLASGTYFLKIIGNDNQKFTQQFFK